MPFSVLARWMWEWLVCDHASEGILFYLFDQCSTCFISCIWLGTGRFFLYQLRLIPLVLIRVFSLFWTTCEPLWFFGVGAILHLLRIRCSRLLEWFFCLRSKPQAHENNRPELRPTQTFKITEVNIFMQSTVDHTYRYRKNSICLVWREWPC